LKVQGPLFECEQLKGRITIDYIDPSNVKNVAEVPMEVLTNCKWR